METRIIPEGFHPGEYLRDEIEARGWSPSDLAEILGYERNVISDIFAGRRSISPEFARALADAFGTSAHLWLNLQSAYKLATTTAVDDAISRRARVYDMAPVREMQKRGWIESTTAIDVLENQICEFFEISNMREEVAFAHSARKSDDYGVISQSQLVWLIMARKMARLLATKAKYEHEGLPTLLETLLSYRENPNESALIPDLLSQFGIRFLIVEELPRTKIDGACFWIDRQSPVIVLSLRYDRIDYFWFSLLHELGHIWMRHGFENPLVETSVIGEDAQASDKKPPEERKADEFATKHLIDQSALATFIRRQKPLFSKSSIVSFAHAQGVHPGIVLGQLHHRRVVPYANLRSMLVAVRSIVTSTALTDGWGRTALT
uniref:Addiction module antidote protein, HigA family n=1 Tax=Oscillatoriales cyanobacterium SpSt-402 TaxID=2282168 RepID=A0A832M4Z1_9CYAN